MKYRFAAFYFQEKPIYLSDFMGEVHVNILLDVLYLRSNKRLLFSQILRK